MNKLITLGLLSVALLTTIAATASDKLTIKVESKMLSISLTEVTEDEIISIKDLEGKILFSEALTKAGVYTKVFSFSTLPSGLYFIESKGEEEIQVAPVLVDSLSVTLVKKESKSFTAPEITLRDDVIRLLVRNENKVPVSIAVYDEYGILLIETEKNTNALVFESYNTVAFATKNIIISVTEGDYNFVKEIKL